jgi:hypothetical protein
MILAVGLREDAKPSCAFVIDLQYAGHLVKIAPHEKFTNDTFNSKKI